MDTTISMKLDIYSYLNEISFKSGLSRERIVRFVISKFIDESPFPKTEGKNIKYQEAYHSWKKLHICFDKSLREQTFDLRKFFKLSLSFIVAYSILHYSHLLFQKKETENFSWLKEYEDRYRLAEYLCDIKVQFCKKMFVCTWVYSSEYRQE